MKNNWRMLLAMKAGKLSWNDPAAWLAELYQAWDKNQYSYFTCQSSCANFGNLLIVLIFADSHAIMQK